MSEGSNGEEPKLVKKSRVPSFLKNIHVKNPFKKDGQINKNAVLAGSLAAILLLVGIGALIFSNNHSDDQIASQDTVGTIEQSPQLGAIVTYREGVLEYKKQGEDWTSAPQELQVEATMSLRTTGAASRAVITLDDGSAFRLDANTEVLVESLNVDRVVVKQKSGYVYNRVTPSTSRDYIVMTDSGQFESEGTAFKTAQTGDEESVEVYESKVTETSINKTADQGKKLYVKNEADESLNGQVVDLDIEALKQDAFTMWNKTLDEQDPNYKDSLGYLKDLTGPDITITNPADGSTVEVAAGSTQGSVEFTGKTEPGSTLTVQSKSQSGSQALGVTVGSDGSFTTPVLSAPLGNSTFEFIGKDKVGNKTVKNVRITFKAKSQPVATEKITLSGKVNGDGKLEFSWVLSGVTTPKGVKLVGDKAVNPTYPEASYKQFVESDKQTTIVKPSQVGSSGDTYYFRVCRYTEEGTCDLYSTQVEITLP